MPWIVENLWLIPALPILAAGFSALARLTGTECRQKVAHGASRGSGVQNTMSPGGAKASWPTHSPIANQEEHHRKVSFKEEFVAFLKKHEIEYDAKYLWE